MRGRAVSRLTDLIGEAYGFADVDAFRRGILSALRTAVPAEYASYNEVDATGLAGWALDPPGSVPEALIERWSALRHEHPVLEHISRTGDGRPRRFSDFLPDDEWRRTRLYREFYRPAGVEAQVAFALPAVAPLVIGLTLNRAARDFSDDEVTLLAAARPHLIRAYRAAVATTTRLRALAALETGLETLGMPLLAVDPEGRVLAATASGRASLFGRLGLPAGTDRLPDDLVARLREVARATPAPLERVVHPVPGGGSMLVRVIAGPPGDGTQMLVPEPEFGGLDLTVLRALGLTRREAEVLRLVALGRRGPVVAETLGISPRTVQKHLQHVYDKLGVSSASEAAITAWAAVGPGAGEDGGTR